jgi:ribulose-phosphate 3-epimerase
VSPVRIAPSLMCADFLSLGEELRALEGADLLHIDVMDGSFVPNFTLGPDFCAAVARGSSLPLDIHLMVENPDAHIPRFASFAGSWISFHAETTRHPLRTVQVIRDRGARPGIAINPGVPLAAMREILRHVDFACLMTVNPGYAGQKLIPGMIDKIARLAAMIREAGLALDIEVDGNVSWENIPPMVEAGATVLVAGSSSLFDPTPGLPAKLARMRRLIGGA